jgi:hypothetical protein
VVYTASKEHSGDGIEGKRAVPGPENHFYLNYSLTMTPTEAYQSPCRNITFLLPRNSNCSFPIPAIGYRTTDQSRRPLTNRLPSHKIILLSPQRRCYLKIIWKLFFYGSFIPRIRKQHRESNLEKIRRW